MSNYAIKFQPDGVATATTGTLTNVKNATALGFTLSLKGERLTGQTLTNPKPVCEAAAGYLNIYIRMTTSGRFTMAVASAVDAETQHEFSSDLADAAIVATDYYTIRAWWDAGQATNKQGIELWDKNGTLVASGYASVNTPIANGTFGDVTFNKTAGQGINNSGNALTVDWLAVWGAMPPAGAPTMPSVGATNLLRLYPCDDGPGSSTIAESVDNVTGVATIAGVEGTNYSWIAITSPADHGTVTLTPASLLNGGSATAAVQWYDALNNPIPDPGTVWSVDSDSLGATINAATGAITTVGAGTATIRATTGAVSATATLTIRPTIVFAETIGVS